jgi:hypothetical protein
MGEEGGEEAGVIVDNIKISPIGERRRYRQNLAEKRLRSVSEIGERNKRSVG